MSIKVGTYASAVPVGATAVGIGARSTATHFEKVLVGAEALGLSLICV